MRGEDANTNKSDAAFTESPPHARGRHAVPAGISESRRITPACAGKTPLRPSRALRLADHPRMRGEDA